MIGTGAGARLKNSLCHIGQPALDQNLLFHAHVGAPPDVIIGHLKASEREFTIQHYCHGCCIPEPILVAGAAWW